MARFSRLQWAKISRERSRASLRTSSGVGNDAGIGNSIFSMKHAGCSKEMAHHRSRSHYHQSAFVALDPYKGTGMQEDGDQEPSCMYNEVGSRGEDPVRVLRHTWIVSEPRDLLSHGKKGHHIKDDVLYLPSRRW